MSSNRWPPPAPDLPAGPAPQHKRVPADRVCQLTVELLADAGYADDVTTLAAQRLADAVPRCTWNFQAR
jgi:hypothetical protein